MTTGELILTALLGGYGENYRALRRLAYGVPDLRKRVGVSPNTLRVTLSRLKKNGLVTNRAGVWAATTKGGEWFRRRRERIGTASGPHRHGSYLAERQNRPRSMIIVFDIPEKEHGRRDWLRIELAALGFVMLQQSVWFGPAPLPREFIKSVDELGLLPYLKFFAAREHEIA